MHKKILFLLILLCFLNSFGYYEPVSSDLYNSSMLADSEDLPLQPIDVGVFDPQTGVELYLKFVFGIWFDDSDQLYRLGYIRYSLLAHPTTAPGIKGLGYDLMYEYLSMYTPNNTYDGWEAKKPTVIHYASDRIWTLALANYTVHSMAMLLNYSTVQSISYAAYVLQIKNFSIYFDDNTSMSIDSGILTIGANMTQRNGFWDVFPIINTSVDNASKTWDSISYVLPRFSPWTVMVSVIGVISIVGISIIVIKKWHLIKNMVGFQS